MWVSLRLEASCRREGLGRYRLLPLPIRPQEGGAGFGGQGSCLAKLTLLRLPSATHGKARAG